MDEVSFKFPAAQEAFEMYGKVYATYIEKHTQELVDKGHDVAGRSLSEALAGNDGV